MALVYGSLRWVPVSVVALGALSAPVPVLSQEAESAAVVPAIVTYPSFAVVGPLPFTSSNDEGGPGIDLVVGYRGTGLFWGAGGSMAWSSGALRSWALFGEVRRRSDRERTFVGKYRWLSGIRLGYAHAEPGGTWAAGGGLSGSVFLGQEYMVGKPVGLQLTVGLGGHWVGGELHGVATGLLGITTRFPWGGALR
jgi:hypothetical protein